MRTRHSLTAAVIALVIILIGIILSLLAGRGPTAKADGPEPAPSTAAAPSPTGRHADRHAKAGGTPTRTPRTTGTKPSKSVVTGTPTPTPTTAKPAAPSKPRLGNATVPDGAGYAVSDDGQAFTMTFSTLEAGSGTGRPSRKLSATVPVSGDAHLVLAVTGYVLTDGSTTAKLTVSAGGGSWTTTFDAGTDRELVRSIDVPLRGTAACRITVKVEVLGADGYLNVLAVDGQLG